MTILDRIIKDIKSAVANPAAAPDPLVVAIFQNDLRRTMVCVNEYGLNIYDLDMAIRYVSSHVTGSQITAVLKKWGKK